MVVVISKFFAKNFFTVTNSKDCPTIDGENSAKCNALNSHIECVNALAVISADPQREGYKLHSLLGSVGKRAETNFNFPAPPFNHISGICKNLADTWPAATRVLSRGRKREDPGNEVKIHAPDVFYGATATGSQFYFRSTFPVNRVSHCDSAPTLFSLFWRRL